MKLKNLQKEVLKPRGSSVMLPHGGLPEIFPPYLAALIASTGGPTGPIGLQFVSRPNLEKKHFKDGLKDPLLEDHNEVAPGLVYKYQSNAKNKTKKPFEYSGRALWTITRHCAAYCRFCTRGREVGILGLQKGVSNAALSNTPHLDMKQIDETLRFIEKARGLNEIILSGGDPLTINPTTLHYVLGRLGALQQKGKLKIVRIGTRTPVHNPSILRDEHFKAIAQLTNPRLMIHVNHPFELTPQTKAVLRRFRQECLATVMTQTVFLKGVNDNVQTLYDLFSDIAAEGVVPYYMYQNDAVYWAQHFTVPMKRAIKIWSLLRPKLSGVAATVRFVIDTPLGYGKVPLPEGGAWTVEWDKGYTDFRGKRFPLE